MPILQSPILQFRPSVAHVRHYLPKIAAAVGRNRNLFPLPIFTEADIARDKPQDRHKAATQLAELIVNSQLKMSGRNSAVAKAILRGFVRWLDGKNYTYTSKTRLELIQDNGWHSYLEGNEEYNLFANPSAPIGDCFTTANALALLLAMNGFPCNELMLVGLQSDGGNPFLFRGGEAAANYMVDAIDSSALAPLVRVGPGRGLERVPAAEADTPFANHWVVGYKGDLYDANYRAIYRNPHNLFAETSRPVSLGQMGAPMNPIFLPDGKVTDSLTVPEQNKIFFQLVEPASLLSAACPSLSGWAHTTVFLVDDVAVAGEDVVTLGSQQVSHKHAKLFGWCVPDEPTAIKRRLMRAVDAYDRSVTGRFFRISTDASKDFCRRSRKWCNTINIQDRNVANNRIYSGVNWDNVVAWGDDNAAKNAIYRAMRTNDAVGTTLRSNLCDAFELPGYLRTA
jgi:hypothetical protein